MAAGSQAKKRNRPVVIITVARWRRKPKRTASARPRAVPGLLTVDDLAERWQVTPERAWKRVRDADLRAVNLGTLKNPELRFRLETVEGWEQGVERYVSTILGGEKATVEADPRPIYAKARGGRSKYPDNDPLAGL